MPPARRRQLWRVPSIPDAKDDSSERERTLLAELAHALLRGEAVDEALQFALDRSCSTVGASLGSVFLVEGASELMRLGAAYQWPEQWRPWLGSMRVRIGFGPSGEAAAERRVIEVPDVFAAPDLEDWQEVARELGFRALVAVPLRSAARVFGAVTFYFAEPGTRPATVRRLLEVVADLMAATAEKGALQDGVRRAEAAVAELSAEQEFEGRAEHRARTESDRFLQRLAAALSESEGTDPLVADLREWVELRRGALALDESEFDPRVPLRLAVGRSSPFLGCPLEAEEPVLPLPALRSDRERIAGILVRLIDVAARARSAGPVRVGVETANGWVEYRVQEEGGGVGFEESLGLFAPFAESAGKGGLSLALAKRLTERLGGELEHRGALGEGTTFVARFPLELPDNPAHASSVQRSEETT